MTDPLDRNLARLRALAAGDVATSASAPAFDDRGTPAVEAEAFQPVPIQAQTVMANLLRRLGFG